MQTIEHISEGRPSQQIESVGADHDDNGEANHKNSNIVDCCSLLANAPVHGDHYEYHADADPLTFPESAWRQEFGDYSNRCLISFSTVYVRCVRVT